MSEHPATESAVAPSEQRATGARCSLAAGYRVLDPNREYTLKAPCPYCGGKLRMSINGAELDSEFGTGWFATDLDINCDTEPDMAGPKVNWDNWWADHSHDFCEKWHDLHERVVRSLKRTHRISYDNIEGEPTPRTGVRIAKER